MNLQRIKTAWKESKNEGPHSVGKVLLGMGFIAVGIPGLFLPFLQGILFILIGLFLLSNRKWKDFYHVMKKK